MRREGPGGSVSVPCQRAEYQSVDRPRAGGLNVHRTSTTESVRVARGSPSRRMLSKKAVVRVRYRAGIGSGPASYRPGPGAYRTIVFGPTRSRMPASIETGA